MNFTVRVLPVTGVALNVPSAAKPRVEKIEVMRHAKVRRAQLYYLPMCVARLHA